VLWRFWYLRGYSGEGSKVLLALLALAPESLDPAIRLEALTEAAGLLTFAADFATARTLFESALTLGRALADQRALGNLLTSLGIFHRVQGELAAARKYDEEAIEIYRALGDRRFLGNCLGNLAINVSKMGDPKAALRLHEESLAIRREFADRWAIAMELFTLSGTLRDLGDLAAARKVSEEALAIYREFKEVPGTTAVLCRLGQLACEEGDYASALQYLKEGLRLLGEGGNRTVIVPILEAIGHASMNYEPKRAARLWGAAERLAEEMSTTEAPADDARARQREAAARAALADDEAFDAAWCAGRALSIKAAIEYALETTLRPDSTG
jgi:tetratricopeptide (TPR) repeat protein